MTPETSAAPADGDLDPDFVRSHFPGLDSGWAFFDNAGGSLPAGNVIDRVAEYMRECPVQLGASYELSELARERFDSATRELVSLLGGKNIGPEQLILGSSASMLLTQLSLAMAPRFEAGDEIVITATDHEANITPWLRLADRGVRIRTWTPGAGRTDLALEDLDALLNERSRLVCFTHATNITGSISPIEEITKIAHARGAKVCVDGVAFAPHRSLELERWNVDYYVFSLYKMFGPHLGALYGRKDALLELSGINHRLIAADRLPEKLQPGSFSYELAYGAGAVAEYLSKLSRSLGGAGPGAAYRAIERHENRLCRRLLEWLESRPGVRVLGPGSTDPGPRLPVVSFTIDGVDSAAVPLVTDRHRVGIRFGHFYSPRLIEHAGLDGASGVVRASMAHYNTNSEVERLIEALSEAI